MRVFGSLPFERDSVRELDRPSFVAPVGERERQVTRVLSEGDRFGVGDMDAEVNRLEHLQRIMTTIRSTVRVFREAP